MVAYFQEQPEPALTALQEVEQAMLLWRRALVVRAQLADRLGIAGSLERLAWGLAVSERFESAAWLLGAAAAQHELMGMDLRHDERLDHTRLTSRTRHQLGCTFADAWSAGHAASLDAAVSRALADVRPLTPICNPADAGCLAQAVS
jgi:hypothetical protein